MPASAHQCPCEPVCVGDAAVVPPNLIMVVDSFVAIKLAVKVAGQHECILKRFLSGDEIQHRVEDLIVEVVGPSETLPAALSQCGLGARDVTDDSGAVAAVFVDLLALEAAMVIEHHSFLKLEVADHKLISIAFPDAPDHIFSSRHAVQCARPLAGISEQRDGSDTR